MDETWKPHYVGCAPIPASALDRLQRNHWYHYNIHRARGIESERDKRTAGPGCRLRRGGADLQSTVQTRALRWLAAVPW